MSFELETEIYSQLLDSLNASEFYLGHLEYPFTFTKAEYKATCTEAFPFDPFDKVICELLQIEDHLSFFEIGQILGLNVGSPIDRTVIKDNAEFEILTDALQSLLAFEMIDGGDIDFSRCRLTPIGQEYAAKKFKFKKTENKKFTIYFDNTTSNHGLAKENFEFSDSRLIPNISSNSSVSSEKLKEIALVQIPDIYNPEKLYSFTDEVCVKRSDHLLTHIIPITYDFKTKKHKLYCLDKSSRKINPKFSNWINSQLEIASQLINELSAKSLPYKDQSSFLSNWSEALPAGKLNASIQTISNLAHFDQFFLFTNLNSFFSQTEKVDFYICLPFFSVLIINQLSEILRLSQNTQSRYYIILPAEIDPSLQAGVDQLISFSRTERNLYVIQNKVKAFLLLVRKTENSFFIELLDSAIGNISVQIAAKAVYDSNAENLEKLLLSSFADSMSTQICFDARLLIQSNLNTEFTKEKLSQVIETEFKLFPFSNITEQAEMVMLTLGQLDNFKVQSIQLLNESLMGRLTNIMASIPLINNLKELENSQSEIYLIQNQSIEADTQLQNALSVSEELLKLKRAEILEKVKQYSFIVDTSILLEDPEIVLRVDKKHSIVIATKVLDELDKHEENKELSGIVSKAKKILQQDKNRNIKHKSGKLKLLPIDLIAKKEHKLILSVAIQYIDNFGILVTSDNSLFEIAKSIPNMQVMNLSDFKKKFDPPFST